MTAHDIRIYGDPILRRKADPVVNFDEELKALAEEMFEVMFDADGIGLAATQVSIARAFLVIGMPQDDEAPPKRLFFANPEITEGRGETPFEEGCLSIPEVRSEVIRPEWIRVRYQDLDGKPMELEADGLLARVLQHEIDHLNGILFVDRLTPARKALLKKQLDKLAEETRAKAGDLKELAKTVV